MTTTAAATIIHGMKKSIQKGKIKMGDRIKNFHPD
jgi:hypothetical protein